MYTWHVEYFGTENLSWKYLDRLCSFILRRIRIRFLCARDGAILCTRDGAILCARDGRHIVDQACFASNGGQGENANVFCIYQQISLRMVFIDRGSVEDFAEIKFTTFFRVEVD